MTSRILFLDTETTGLPSDTAPIEFSGNPVPIEVASVLCETDDRDSRRNTYCTYIGFNDVQCDPHAFAAHRIEDDTRKSLGRAPRGVMTKIIADMTLALSVVGHNIQFDLKMLRIAAYRADSSGTLLEALDSEIARLDVQCTLNLATDICCLPATERMRARFPGKLYKPPNLGEAYRFFFGRDFTGAHGALADCLAARDVYYAIRDWKARNAPAAAT